MFICIWWIIFSMIEQKFQIFSFVFHQLFNSTCDTEMALVCVGKMIRDVKLNRFHFYYLFIRFYSTQFIIWFEAQWNIHSMNINLKVFSVDFRKKFWTKFIWSTNSDALRNVVEWREEKKTTHTNVRSPIWNTDTFYNSCFLCKQCCCLFSMCGVCSSVRKHEWVLLRLMCVCVY